MKKFLLALFFFLASTASAQEYTSRYFHYNQWFDAPPPFQIRATTIDGADTNAMILSGGGGGGTTRGAYIGIYGNEYSGVGELLLGSGNVTGSQISLITGGIEHLSVPLSITAAATLAFGVAADTSPSLLIRSRKADAADDATLQLTAGGAWGTTRGAGIQFLGNDYGGAGAGAGVSVETGTGTLNAFSITQAGNSKFGLLATADADDVTLLLGRAATTTPVFHLRAQTADADDDGILCLTGSGSCGAASRGGYFQTAGNEWSGDTYVSPGEKGVLILYRADDDSDTSRKALTFAGSNDDEDVDIAFGIPNPTTPTYQFRTQTADGDDDATVILSGGGAVGNGRGGWIKIYGADVGTVGGNVEIYTDYNGVSGTFKVCPGSGGACTLTYDTTGLKLAGTGVAGTLYFNGASSGINLGGLATNFLEIPQWAVGSIPACTVGSIAVATDSDNCAAGGGDGALCYCKSANTWVLLANI